MTSLSKRVKEISKRHGLSHIGSCLSVLPILEDIYCEKKKGETVIIDGAHSHLAHLVVKEAYEGLKDIEDILSREGIHCDRKAGCDVSGGSLGHGLGIAIGIAIAQMSMEHTVTELRNKHTGAQKTIHHYPKIHVIITDGSICEGSGAEALRVIKTLGIKNIEIHANFNGYTAVSEIDIDYWEQFVQGFGVPVFFHRTHNGLPELDGVKGHYLTL